MKLVLENRQLQEWKASLFYTGIVTIVTVVIWIGISVYGLFSKTSVDPEIEKLTQPLSPTLDIELIEQYAKNINEPPAAFVITAVSSQGDNSSTFTVNPFTDAVQSNSTASASPF